MSDPIIAMPPVIVRPGGGPEPTAGADGIERGMGASPYMEELQHRIASGDISPAAKSAFDELRRRHPDQFPDNSPDSVAPPTQREGSDRPIGLAATGFNKGLGSFVDLLNDGMKAIGLPTSDEPFMGSAFVDKYLGGSAFQPKTAMEHVIQRAGFEVGANVPLLAGALNAKAAAAGKELITKAADSTIEAVKALPKVLVEQMADVPAPKLAALETAIAAGAGVGADVIHQVFPEGGATAEFFGELLGSFAPSVMLGLLGKARELGSTALHAGRRVVGMETEEETKQRLQEKLKDTAKPEDIKAGVKRADELRQEISPGAEKGQGLELTAGEAVGGSVAKVQRSLERTGGQAFGAQAVERRKQNIEAVKSYFDATAPEGNPTRLVENLEAKRAKDTALLELGLARTEAKVEAARGNLSARTANLLNDMEARMFAADQRVEARLAAIGSKLNPKERGAIIRQEYEAELGAFRERSRADYHELEMLGHAELPVTGTLQTLANLRADFPAHLQAIAKINPRVGEVLDNLGHEYELVLRSQKALADMGIRDASGKGVRIRMEQYGHGGTDEVRGLSRGTPDWYRSLTIREKNPLTREQIESRLDRWAAGFPHNPDNPTDMEIYRALRGDAEFARSPYNEPVVRELGQTPSSGLRDLRQVRSDLLAMSRQAKASDNRVQRYVLNELIQALDGDIDQLLPGQSPFAGVYPEHGALYRQVSADYRAGVETLMKGTANRLRMTNRDGAWREYDESIPALFWRNQTTMEEFEKALGTKPMAKAALRDYALDDFLTSVMSRREGKWNLDQAAYDEWMKDHAAHLNAFPDLKKVFADTKGLLEQADALKQQVDVFRSGKKGEEALLRRVQAERRPGDITVADVTAQEAHLNHVGEVVDRSKQEWETSVAGLFLKERPEYAAQRLATSRDPLRDYEAVYAKVKHDPDAVAGLNKAIWNALTDKIQPKLTGLTGSMNLGVFHKELQNWIYGNEELMTRVLGDDGMKRIKTTAEAIEKIALGGKEGSDTAINLQVQAALASTWMSRAFAVASGRVSHLFAGAERVGQYLTKYFQGLTQKQQDAILLESFFDPKVYETLVLAGTYGPKNDIVKHRTKVHLNLMNLSEQTAEKLDQ
jgi:hypothetical protein